MEVEDPAHEEEGEVVERPAQQQLTASSQQDLGQPCPRSTAPVSAGRGGDPGLQPSSAPSLLCDINRPPHLLGLPSLTWTKPNTSSSWQRRGAAGTQEPCSPPTQPGEASAPTAGVPNTPKETKILHTPQTASPTSTAHIFAATQMFAAADRAKVRSERRMEVGQKGVWDSGCSDRELQRPKQPR